MSNLLMSNLLPPLHDASFPMPNLLSLLYDANYPMPNFCHHYPMPPPIHKLTLPDGRLPLPDGHYMIISAQKPRFCARKARKQGFSTPKAHKNPDFVLAMSENKGSQPQKRTKTSILCSGRGGLAPGREEISIGKRNRCLPANHRARF